MFSRFANPHLKESHEQYVSRQEIEEEWGFKSSSIPEEGLERDINELLGKAITNREWDLLTAMEPPRKRAKLAVKDASLPQENKEAVYSFRLVSRRNPPRPITCAPKPPRALPRRAIEPSPEDNEEESARRVERAAAAAVDVDWLLREAKKPPITLTNSRSNRLVHVSITGVSTADPLMLVERELSVRPILKRRVCCEHVKPEPSPHEPRCKRVTIVSAGRIPAVTPSRGRVRR